MAGGNKGLGQSLALALAAGGADCVVSAGFLGTCHGSRLCSGQGRGESVHAFTGHRAGLQGDQRQRLAPIFTRTAMAGPILDDPVKREWVLSRIPMKRTGELDDLFGPVVFPASESSNFVSGYVLVIDGERIAAEQCGPASRLPNLMDS